MEEKWSHPFGKVTFFKSLWHFESCLLAAVFNIDKWKTENKASKPEEFGGEPTNRTVNPNYELTRLKPPFGFIFEGTLSGQLFGLVGSVLLNTSLA